MLSIALAFAAYCQQAEFTDLQKLSTYLKAIHAKKGFNGEVLVARGSTILFRETIGHTSYEHNVELKYDAKYRIASISKTFTGTLIAIAQEEGKLNVQDRAIDYIPGLSSNFKSITIRQLLAHTSGLPHNEGIPDYWLVKSKLHLTPAQILTEINSLNLLFEPGTQMHYSSLGYYLLALVLEGVYKHNFENILKDKIFNKLGMTETGIADNLKIIPGMASGYHLVTDDSLVVAPYRSYAMLKGAGDMYSTAGDLLKWSNSFFSTTLLGEKAKAAVFTPQGKPADGSDLYGYGWFIGSNTPRAYYHGGGIWGFSTHLALYPDQQISIILLSNVSTLPISEIAADVEKIVFGKPFEIPAISEAVDAPVNLEMYSGTFLADANQMPLTTFTEANSLYAKLGNNPPFEIYPKGDHQFFAKKIEVEFSFEVSNNLVTGLSAKRMGQNLHFTRGSNQ